MIDTYQIKQSKQGQELVVMIRVYYYPINDIHLMCYRLCPDQMELISAKENVTHYYHVALLKPNTYVTYYATLENSMYYVS